MSVADRVTECIIKYNANDLVNALIQLCIALDGTSKNEYPRMKKVGERFKAFIKANQDIITFFTFNTNIFIDCEFGGYTIEQFIYKVLRCGLLHEGEVSAMFKFAEAGDLISIGVVLAQDLCLWRAAGGHRRADKRATISRRSSWCQGPGKGVQGQRALGTCRLGSRGYGVRGHAAADGRAALADRIRVAVGK